MSNQSFGDLLRQYREDHNNMSQQDLADILGTSKQVISRYETGQRDPKISTAVEYAEKLGIPLSCLLDSDPPNTEVDSILDYHLSDFELAVLKQLRQLSEDQQRTFLAFLTSLTGTPEP